MIGTTPRNYLEICAAFGTVHSKVRISQNSALFLRYYVKQSKAAPWTLLLYLCNAKDDVFMLRQFSTYTCIYRVLTNKKMKNFRLATNIYISNDKNLYVFNSFKIFMIYNILNKCVSKSLEF